VVIQQTDHQSTERQEIDQPLVVFACGAGPVQRTEKGGCNETTDDADDGGGEEMKKSGSRSCEQ
jgi:hypothetical protein